MQLKHKKFFRYGLATLLISGVVLALGFLSFTGMLALFGLVGLAIGSFALTGMIEGEVYAQNILHGLEKLLKGKWFESAYLKRAVYIRELNKLLKNEENVGKSEFLSKYLAHLKALKKLHIEKEKLGILYFFSGKFKQKVEKSEKLLRDDEKYFIDLMEGTVSTNDPFMQEFNSQNNPLEEEYSIVKQENKIAILEEIKQKHAISPWCLAAGMFAGVGMGLVFFSVAPESIVATAAFFGIALSASAFPIGITVAIAILAIVAAVGYAVLIYNTLTDMLQNDAVKNWLKKIQKFFSPPEKVEVTPTFILKRVFGTIGVVLLVGLCVFATITTAGTWWYAAKAGVIFILPQLKSFAELLSTPVVIVMGVAQLGFNLYNSLKTAGIIAKRFMKFSQHLNIEWIKKWIKNKFNESTFKDYFHREGFFRSIALIIALPFKFVVFVGHVIASAVMSDRFAPIPTEVCVVPAGFVETLSDWSFFFEEHHHSHEHTDIPGKVLLVILSPLYFLSAACDFFSHSNKEESLSFGRTLIKAFFGIEAFDTLVHVENILEFDVVNDGHQKALSAHKIYRRLLDSDKSQGLSPAEQDFFKQQEQELRKYYTDAEHTSATIFTGANGSEHIRSELAKAFWVKVQP